MFSALWAKGNGLPSGEDLLLSADAAVEILSEMAPWPTNSAIVALSGRDKLVPNEMTGWQPSVAEFSQALTLSKLPEARQNELLEIYRRAETNFLAFTEARDDYNYRRYWANYGYYEPPPKPRMGIMEFPPDMPEEFLFLLDGLQHFYNDEVETARERWERLEALPLNRKTYCAKWGRVLMAESYADKDPYRALRELEKLRNEIIKSPARDEKLTACLLRFEAADYAAVTNYPQAMNCYFALNLLGFRHEEMVRHIANLILRLEGADLAVAARSRAVAAMTTWHAATFYSDLRLLSLSAEDAEHIKNWLRALKREGSLGGAADLAAVAAYRAGDGEMTAEALDSARAMAPFAAWILAKTKLRSGDPKGAASDLATVFYSFKDLPESLRQEIGHELALLYISFKNYKEALKVTLLSGDWQEASYVAEDVLSLGELEEFVKGREREADNKKPGSGLEARLRYLLARRLARSGSLSGALPYFPKLQRAFAEQLLASQAMGANTGLSAEERGLARADAARALYYGGEPIYAAENEPDYLINEGREAVGGLWQRQLRSRRGSQLAPLSDDEDKRVQSNRPSETARERCLKLAVDEVWQAAELLPDNSQALAELFCEAGKWTENCDEKTARALYDALVERCPDTKLGNSARELRWFPQED